VHVGAGLLTDSAVAVPVAGTAAQRCVRDAAAVVASLRHKLIHCIDEQRDVQRCDVEQFERLLTTPGFIASIDSWP